jgi:hypothetical protein
MNWKVDRGERRTFISTPYGFRIELQTSKDIVDSITDNPSIQELHVETKIKGLENDLTILFGKPINNITTINGDSVRNNEAVLKDFPPKKLEDPNGVEISS